MGIPATDLLFKADHETAVLCVVGAQGPAGRNANDGVRVELADCGCQTVSLFAAVDVVNQDPATNVALLFHDFDNFPGRLLAAPQFAKHFESSLSAGGTVDAKIEKVGQFCNRWTYPAIICEVVEFLQDEEQVRLLNLLVHEFDDFVKSVLLVDEGRQLRGEQPNLGASGFGVEHVNSDFGVVRHV